MNTTGDTTVQDDSDEQQEVIEVQILPQVSSIYPRISEKISSYTNVVELNCLFSKISLRLLSIVNSPKYAGSKWSHQLRVDFRLKSEFLLGIQTILSKHLSTGCHFCDHIRIMS